MRCLRAFDPLPDKSNLHNQLLMNYIFSNKLYPTLNDDDAAGSSGVMIMNDMCSYKKTYPSYNREWKM